MRMKEDEDVVGVVGVLLNEQQEENDHRIWAEKGEQSPEEKNS